MTDWAFRDRCPRRIFQKEGVEDERAKAARILALCEGKPIRRIRHSSDITPMSNPYPPPPDQTTQAVREKRARVEAMLQVAPTPGPVLDRALGGKEAARATLAGMQKAGIADYDIVMMEAVQYGGRGGVRRVAMWRLL